MQGTPEQQAKACQECDFELAMKAEHRQDFSVLRSRAQVDAARG